MVESNRSKPRVVFLSTYPLRLVNLILSAAPDSLGVRYVSNRLSEMEKVLLCQGAHYALVSPSDLTSVLVQGCPRLKFVQLLTADYSRINLAELAGSGLVVAHNPHLQPADTGPESNGAEASCGQWLAAARYAFGNILQAANGQAPQWVV